MIFLLFFGYCGPLLAEAALTTVPSNTAAVVGSTVELHCTSYNDSYTPRVMWAEYITNPNGNIISDSKSIISSNPISDRYSIVGGVNDYHLQIRDVQLSDGGTYVCQDITVGPPDVFRGFAELIVLAPRPKCFSSVDNLDTVLENSYQSNECYLDYQGGITPNITWSGIEPFTSAYAATDSQIWGGMQFNAIRDMEGRPHYATVYFTDYFPVKPDCAQNVPEYKKEYQGREMHVRWGPKNLYVQSSNPSYEAGEVLTCVADANPPAKIRWVNLNTLEIIPGNQITIEESWRGYKQTLRCEAKNEINGMNYHQNLFVSIEVQQFAAPTNLHANPIKTIYQAGEVIYCGADAYPAATYQWTNMRTLESYPGDKIRMDESWRGLNQTLRCTASNQFKNGSEYSNYLFIAADVYGGPIDVQIHPNKTTYYVGDVLTCTADAVPPATFKWLNNRNYEWTDGDTLNVDERWAGYNQSVKCEARNKNNGVENYNYVYIVARVPPLAGPTNMQVHPNKTAYEVGEVIKCTADANPPATFVWTNMRTLESFPGDTLRIDESLMGYPQNFRCEAENYFNYSDHTNQIFISVDLFSGPTNLQIHPNKTSYAVGDKITCTADANPPATFRWLNMWTNEYTDGDTITVEDSWVGFNRTLKCEANNVNNGFSYNGYLYMIAYTPAVGAPTNIQIHPSKTTYDIGDVLTCTADADPPASFHWANMKTLEIFQGDTITIDESFSQWDNVTLRCQAYNLINGFTYSQTLYINVILSEPEPTTIPPTPTPTTPAPAAGPCTNSSGYWVGNDPDAALCLEVDSGGRVLALWRNDSSYFYVTGYGSADMLFEDYKHIAFSVVWPYLDQGWVTGYIGECHVCNGEEVILLSGVSRSRSWAPGCGQTGGTPSTKLYTLTRRLPSCRGQEIDVFNPKPWIEEKMGVKARTYQP